MARLSAQETRHRIQGFQLEQKTPRFGFSLPDQATTQLTYHWHSHSRHQLIYSLSGRIVLESHQGKWLLPPLRAAWIPAQTKHRTTLDRARTISVYFKSIPPRLHIDSIRILRATPLLRELLLYSLRWPANKRLSKTEAPLASSFFQTLSLLCLDWIQQELPFSLPTPRDPAVNKAVDYLLNHLDSADISHAAQASGQSVRTLRRRFLPATGLTWQQYALHARMMRAMDLFLTTRQSVLEVSYAVGYKSPSAFAKAFTHFSGSAPLAFRKARTAAALPVENDSPLL